MTDLPLFFSGVGIGRRLILLLVAILLALRCVARELAGLAESEALERGLLEVCSLGYILDLRSLLLVILLPRLGRFEGDCEFRVC